MIYYDDMMLNKSTTLENDKVIVSTFHNDLFKKQSYDEIKSIQISATNLGKISILKKN